ncbi:MAG: translational GTPase TypA [bacterium]
MIESIRNVAIVAHVDHGKTTLVDRLLQQSGALGDRPPTADRLMDSNDLERERGITILAKNTSIRWKGLTINIVDTPGHADFGGEVERILSMVDSVLLLVDAVDGPMPQTRFVTQKAFAHGLRPIVVVNKVDRDGARAHWTVDQTFDLFHRLGATDEQLDFPIIFTSALEGWASLDAEVRGTDMTPLFETIRAFVPPPPVDLEGPLQLQVSALDWNSYVGAIGIGRITRGVLRRNRPVVVVDRDGKVRQEKILQVFGFEALSRVEREEANAGDIVAFTGIELPRISDTVCDPDHPDPLPPLAVDEPTIRMTFEVNTSPFAGRDGKYLTSRQIRERLAEETIHNVALRVEETGDSDKFLVSGRGELHLSILLENLRREGYEMAVSRPRVIRREIDGRTCEPYEDLTVDVEERHQGAVLEALGARAGTLKGIHPDGRGRVRLDWTIPTRGLIGFQTTFRTLTNGTGLMYHVFEKYAPAKPERIGRRSDGVMVSMATGKALGYALDKLQERGRLFVSPGDEVYEGQIVGIHAKDDDLVVNPLKGKKLTNMRAAGKDDSILLTPPIRFSLEEALEFLDDDELVEITPGAIRLRKRYLKDNERALAAKRAADVAAA